MRAVVAGTLALFVAAGCGSEPARDGSLPGDSGSVDTADGSDVPADFGDDTLDTMEDAAADVADASEDVGETDLGADTELDVPDATDDADGGTMDAWLDRPPLPCDGELGSDVGTPWDGWANLQHPEQLDVATAATTPSIYGQVWQDGVTDAPRPAAGWSAELLWGPWGTDPRDARGCWRRSDATFNVDVGNNDEYEAQITPLHPGLYGLAYRFRPPGGSWRYGDLDGSDNGFDTDQLARLVVRPDGPPERLVIVTLNLRCRADGWEARRSAVIDALVELHPDVIALQEDCSAVGGAAQSRELAESLGRGLGHGYARLRVVSHQATRDSETFDEGIALLSAWPIVDSEDSALPGANFGRRLLTADVDLGGVVRTFAVSHFDFGANSTEARSESAELVVASLAPSTSVFAGDLNTTPGSAAISTLAGVMQDSWAVAGDGAGLTFPADSPTRRIDYIFAGTQWEVEAIELVGDGDALSDHLGVAAQLRRR